MSSSYTLRSDFNPCGDQPSAIVKLSSNVLDNVCDQVLFGVTGSGKTFTIANVVAKLNRPALVIAPNKVLAAQLYEELLTYFPENHVEYFVSYYDYYQPEAYLPRTDTFIEKDAAINERIDTLRHSATRSLLMYRDVIVVASVSCIYGIGLPEIYLQSKIELNAGQHIDQLVFIEELVKLDYLRSKELKRGAFCVRGDTIDIYPAHYTDKAWRITFFYDEVEQISEFCTKKNCAPKLMDNIVIFPNSHYITNAEVTKRMLHSIRIELNERIKELSNDSIAACRIKERTEYDLEVIKESGTCKGIENYSRYLSGRSPGAPPPTLFEYMPSDSLLFIDESHITIPQIRAMFNGDYARKKTLIEHGFRLCSALDNRPLKFHEWESIKPQTIYVSATPGEYELSKSKNNIAEQIIRPTGLLDPKCLIRPSVNQIEDLMQMCFQTIELGNRVLALSITKKSSEYIVEYMLKTGIKAAYLHSGVKLLNRVKIINQLREGIYDVLVGVNLLREGLDIPECGLVAILDADKEGFLRSTTTLTQIIGRAARNSSATVVLYANNVTTSMQRAIDETKRRRIKQEKHNERYGIVPSTVSKKLSNTLQNLTEKSSIKEQRLIDENKDDNDLRFEMEEAAERLDFERAMELRNILHKRRKRMN